MKTLSRGCAVYVNEKFEKMSEPNKKRARAREPGQKKTASSNAVLIVATLEAEF